MGNLDLNLVYIGFGILMLFLLFTNLYWGIFFILLAQPLFVSTFAEGAGLSLVKMVYGVLFAVWFAAWGLRKLLAGKANEPAPANSVRAPALAFGALLGVAIALGLLYGASPGDLIRDLSQYVGYLAVLPLLDLVRTPTQAKRLIFLLALLGLPSSLLSDVYQIAQKQHEELSTTLLVLNYAQAYWGPIQGALWAVAVSFPGFFLKLLAWGWLLFKASLSVVSGYRYMLLVFLLSASTAFMVSGRIARHKLARYLIPLVLALTVGVVLADLSGMITLPISDITRHQYSTMLSGKRFQQDPSMQGRFLESRALFQNFLKNPVTGIGLGHTLKDPRIPGGYTFRFHNGYLETLMKFGVVGTCIFAWYFFAVILQAFKIARTSDRYLAQVIGLGMVIWLVPAIVASLAVSYFADRGFALTVGVMAGLLPALISDEQSGKG